MDETRHSYLGIAPLLVADGCTVDTVHLRGSVNFVYYTVKDDTVDMVAFIRHLTTTKVVVVANSFTAACTMLLTLPHAVSKLAGIVILGPFAGVWPEASLLQTLRADFDDCRTFLTANVNQPGRLNALVQLIQASKANDTTFCS
ncbi:hypothetical protein SPRG_06347 [Saprolegnia parasitica CBS 223.65]|uniref:Serine aminopeptidase S33 domain-containing protein n=1 Tax=Saprolegnia parasitica (strain CBS 223.65) TaxID=695850 RepID=A0A067CNB1_SAPPC|nr:hypothetical protein SPRG_06347 [Saprolegnia parasitica CBS 223.65]KDO28297.1 hypothetical protein SPRG_06347 [Saprolegnia parasitica CBS 223.65]|eukprot:XP_012201116.1 hypothetical protein SPRG_06347 [Saprolegnia parasitica CBS 223.65]